MYLHAVVTDALAADGPSSTSQPVIQYIDRDAYIDFEQQPTSQNNSSAPASVTRGHGYAAASPPTSSNAGPMGAMMRSTGSRQGQGGPLGPGSLVGVIHDTMSSLVSCSTVWRCFDSPSGRVLYDTSASVECFGSHRV